MLFTLVVDAHNFFASQINFVSRALSVTNHLLCAVFVEKLKAVKRSFATLVNFYFHKAFPFIFKSFRLVNTSFEVGWRFVSISEYKIVPVQ